MVHILKCMILFAILKKDKRFLIHGNVVQERAKIFSNLSWITLIPKNFQFSNLLLFLKKESIEFLKTFKIRISTDLHVSGIRKYKTTCFYKMLVCKSVCHSVLCESVRDKIFVDAISRISARNFTKHSIQLELDINN